MDFIKQKQDCLSKIDKSKKGSIDEPIAELINLINTSPNYYTTSSCSGRVVLISKKSDKKNDANWLFVSHEKIKIEQINPILQTLPIEDVFFRFEPLILHICARTIEDAQILIDYARNIGFKRSGLQSTNKIIVEIASTEIIDTIISKDNKLLVNLEYISILIDEANKKFERTKKKIESFSKFFSELNNE